MSARGLLDQLLQQAQGLLQGAQGGMAGGSPPSPDRHPGTEAAGPGTSPANGGLAAQLPNGLGKLLSGFGGGALSGGALGLMLGNKKMRKMGGSVAMYGGMAALGALAYRAYGNWQQQQRQDKPGAPMPEPQTMDRLPAAELEAHSAAVLTAMIAASKADGHIGTDERQLLQAELSRLSGEASDRQWLDRELSSRLDPVAVAGAAKTPEMAAEMYLASLLIVDEESPMERAYLEELARHLQLAPSLVAALKEQVQGAREASPDQAFGRSAASQV